MTQATRVMISADASDIALADATALAVANANVHATAIGCTQHDSGAAGT